MCSGLSVPRPSQRFRFLICPIPGGSSSDSTTHRNVLLAHLLGSPWLTSWVVPRSRTGSGNSATPTNQSHCSQSFGWVGCLPGPFPVWRSLAFSLETEPCPGWLKVYKASVLGSSGKDAVTDHHSPHSMLLALHMIYPSSSRQNPGLHPDSLPNHKCSLCSLTWTWLPFPHPSP